LLVVNTHQAEEQYLAFKTVLCTSIRLTRAPAAHQPGATITRMPFFFGSEKL